VISNSNGRDGGKYMCATFLSIYHNNNNKYIGHRTERPKRALAVHVEVLLIKHNHIKARKRWHRRTDGQTPDRCFTPSTMDAASLMTKTFCLSTEVMKCKGATCQVACSTEEAAINSGAFLCGNKNCRSIADR